MAHHALCTVNIAGVWSCVYGCTEGRFATPTPTRDVQFDLDELRQQYDLVHDDLVQLSRLALDYCDKSADLMMNDEMLATMDLRRRIRDIADRWAPHERTKEEL